MKIVLTGGPCAGKTTALSRIPERLRSLGWNCYIVPEAATIMIQSGISFRGQSAERIKLLQTELMKLQLHLEDSYEKMAKAASGRYVLLCDRGLMDSAAYMAAQDFSSVLKENEWSRVALRDERYTGVIHLQTAADGAEAHYTTENNTARLETPEEARQLDGRTREAWIGCPHLRVIDNVTGFNEKILRAEAAICRILGEPEPRELERRYLVNSWDADALDFTKWPVKYETLEIIQTYLTVADNTSERVRKRGQHGANVYTHTIKRSLAHGEAEEVERQISLREYNNLLQRADPDRRPINKERTCFLWDGRYFELDCFKDRLKDLQILEIEVDSMEEKVNIPPFLKIDREITYESGWSNHFLAKGLPITIGPLQHAINPA